MHASCRERSISNCMHACLCILFDCYESYLIFKVAANRTRAASRRKQRREEEGASAAAAHEISNGE